MSSLSRNQFLADLAALRSAVDEPAVTSATPSGAFLRRGLTVAAFNLLETFVSDRWGELAHYMNSGHSQFLDLPERMQARAIRQTMAVAQAHVRRSGMELADLRVYAAETGRSLVAVGASLELSANMWLWGGSNMSPEAYHESLSHIHVADPWKSLLTLTSRVGFPAVDAHGDPIDLKQELASLARERHQSAHVSSHPVTTIWLRAVPTRILRFAVGFDILASLGAREVHLGSTAFFADSKAISASNVRLTFVQERRRDFAEIHEGRTRAAFVDADGDSLFKAACVRANNSVVVRSDISGMTLDWSISGPG